MSLSFSILITLRFIGCILEGRVVCPSKTATHSRFQLYTPGVDRQKFISLSPDSCFPFKTCTKPQMNWTFCCSLFSFSLIFNPILSSTLGHRDHQHSRADWSDRRHPSQSCLNRTEWDSHGHLLIRGVQVVQWGHRQGILSLLSPSSQWKKRAKPKGH